MSNLRTQKDHCYAGSFTLPLEGPWGFLGIVSRTSYIFKENVSFQGCRCLRGTWYKVGPEPIVINRVITLLNGQKYMGDWGEITLLVGNRGFKLIGFVTHLCSR